MNIFTKKVPKNISLSNTALIIGFVFCFCWIMNGLADNTMANRLLGFCGLQIILLFPIIKKRKAIVLNNKLLIASLGSLFCIQAISLAYSINVNRGIYELQNTLLLINSFLITRYYYNPKTIPIFRSILYAICIAYLSYALLQFLQINAWDKQTLYNITSLNGHKNLFSSFCILLIGALCLIDKKRDQPRIATPLLIFLLFAAVFLTQTRATILGIGLGATIVCAIHGLRNAPQQYRSVWSLAITICIIAGIICLTQTSLFLNQLNAESSIERLLIWENTFSLANKHAWMGIGAGNWPIVFPSAGLPDIIRVHSDNIIFQKVHNEFLQIYAELGVFGLCSYCILAFSFIRMSIHHFRSNPNRYHSIFLLCAIAYGANVFFSFPNSRAAHLMILGLLLGIMAKESDSKKISNIHLGRQAIGVLLALTFVSFTVSTFRIRGEAGTKTLLSERKSKSWENVARLSRSTENIFYDLDNTSIPIAWYAGMAHFQLGNKDAALEAFKKAYELNPYNHHVLNNYALTIAKSNPALAEKLLTSAITINPQFDSGRGNLVRILMKNGNLEAAEDQIGKLKDTTLQVRLTHILEEFKTQNK